MLINQEKKQFDWQFLKKLWSTVSVFFVCAVQDPEKLLGGRFLAYQQQHNLQISRFSAHLIAGFLRSQQLSVPRFSGSLCVIYSQCPFFSRNIFFLRVRDLGIGVVFWFALDLIWSRPAFALFSRYRHRTLFFLLYHISAVRSIFLLKCAVNKKMNFIC